MNEKRSRQTIDEKQIPAPVDEEAAPVWKRPQLEQLRVSLNTSFLTGSNSEGEGRPTTL